jgi:hypothetical protein
MEQEEQSMPVGINNWFVQVWLGHGEKNSGKKKKQYETRGKIFLDATYLLLPYAG